MMQQYREAKERYPGMLLLFRMGDFFELFFEDAEIASRVLDLKLTSRDGDIPMAGVPHRAVDSYLRTLIRAGHRVAVCDQVEDASQAKGLVRRDVTRVVTPGTLTEDDLLDPRQSNYLVAFTPLRNKAKGRIGLAWVDPSTGQFYAADVPRERLLDTIARLSPAECLVAEADAVRPESMALLDQLRESLPGLTISERPDWTFDSQTSREALFKHFAVSTLAGFGFEDAQPCLESAGSIVQYLQETLKASLTHLNRLRPYVEHRYLFLDDVTRRSLELTRTLREGARAGSLLSLLDRTVSTMGSRLLHDWLLAPLAEAGPIEARLDAVQELVTDHSLRQDLRGSLNDVYDLQRLTSRVSTNRASPRDLRSIGVTLQLLPRLKAKLTARRSSLLCDLESRLELCPDLREALETALAEDPPNNAKEGGVIRRGYDADLDELHAIRTDGKDWIVRFQADEIRNTGIPSLKVGFNQVHGYYIEVTHTHKSRIPEGYERRQTLKNAERYITAELKEHEEKVLSAEEKITAREYELFVALRDRVASQTERLLQTGEVIAHIDVLASLAELAAERNYNRPQLSEEPIVEIEAGRHPVLDQTLPQGTFVPNDTNMGADVGQFLLITGPNMGGKSCYIRQVALLTLMTQMGSFIPAKRARIGLTDRIFTRVGASDEINRAQSTFMVEMTEAANILNNATERSLVILDEIGRGTSTYDGVSLAWGITEYLHERIRCRTLFATHYHELAQLTERLAGLRNFNALVHEGESGITFLHKISPGNTDKSYGIHVAERAGIPQEVLSRARQVLADLEAHHVKMPESETSTIRRPRTIQSSLFASTDDPVLDALRDLDVDGMSLKEIVEQVRRWKRELS